jgi:chromosome segregation ATPase
MNNPESSSVWVKWSHHQEIKAERDRLAKLVDDYKEVAQRLSRQINQLWEDRTALNAEASELWRQNEHLKARIRGIKGQMTVLKKRQGLKK